jgi:hypothetical protein
MMFNKILHHLERVMELKGENFVVMRDGYESHVVKGVRNTEENTNRKYLTLYHDSDVRPDDLLVGEVSKDRFFIIDVESDVVEGKVLKKRGYYMTQKEYEQQKQNNGSPSFHIQNAYGSIIGTQTHATIESNQFGDIYMMIEQKGGHDAAELMAMIREIEKALSKGEIKKGALSRFSSLMEKHSWITGAIAQMV